MMNPHVKIVRNTVEPCEQAGKDCMTLYFEGAPTVKQIEAVANQVAMGCRMRPNMKSRNLRYYTKPVDELVRVQLAD